MKVLEELEKGVYKVGKTMEGHTCLLQALEAEIHDMGRTVVEDVMIIKETIADTGEL